MILYRNRLAFGAIKNFIVTIFTMLYKALALLNLQLTLLLALVGVILYFTGVFEKNPAVLMVFYIFVIISIAYAILTTIKKLLGIDKKIKKSKGAQIISSDTEEIKEKLETQQEVVMPSVEKPTYFKVKNQPDYIMAEYHDRYELLKKTESGLKKIRTDYKN